MDNYQTNSFSGWPTLLENNARVPANIAAALIE